jgi:acyl-ACP thioesterase
MVNSETRRLIKADEFMRDFPINSERLFESNLAKLPNLENQVEFEALEVLFTETDMNKHMNNVSYIDRIINSYGYNFLLGHQIKTFEINFLKEALPGDLLFVQQQQLSQLYFLNNIVRQSDSAEMVRTQIEWI